MPDKAANRYRVLSYLVKGPCHTGALLSWQRVWKRVEATLTDIGLSRSTMYEIKKWLKETGAFTFIKKGRETFIRLKKVFLPERKEKGSGSMYKGAKGKDSYSKSRIPSEKMDKLSWFLAQSFGDMHYDNCKVTHFPKVTAKSIKRLLQFGVSRKQIKALYAAGIERFHQMANDKGEKFMPTGIAALLNSWDGKISLSDAIESFFRRFDIPMGQSNAKTHCGANVGVSEQIAPKGQEGGYYSTMEEFYKAQELQQKQQVQETAESLQQEALEPDEQEPNLIAEFMNKHKIKEFGAGSSPKEAPPQQDEPKKENLIAKFLKTAKAKKKLVVKPKRALNEQIHQIAKLIKSFNPHKP